MSFQESQKEKIKINWENIDELNVYPLSKRRREISFYDAYLRDSDFYRIAERYYELSSGIKRFFRDIGFCYDFSIVKSRLLLVADEYDYQYKEEDIRTLFSSYGINSFRIDYPHILLKGDNVVIQIKPCKKDLFEVCICKQVREYSKEEIDNLISLIGEKDITLDSLMEQYSIIEKEYQERKEQEKSYKIQCEEQTKNELVFLDSNGFIINRDKNRYANH